MFGWGVKKISTAELAEKLAEGKQTIIDVREPYEFAAGHVKGAVNIPLGADLRQAPGRADRVARADRDEHGRRARRGVARDQGGHVCEAPPAEVVSRNP